MRGRLLLLPRLVRRPAIWRLETIFYASVMIAQAILESDSGQSTLSQKPSYNFFGIKGGLQWSKCNPTNLGG